MGLRGSPQDLMRQGRSPSWLAGPAEFLVAGGGPLKGEGDEQAGRPVGPVGSEQIGHQNAPHQVVVAMVFATPVRVIDVVELVSHVPYIGSDPS